MSPWGGDTTLKMNSGPLLLSHQKSLRVLRFKLPDQRPVPRPVERRAALLATAFLYLSLAGTGLRLLGYGRSHSRFARQSERLDIVVPRVLKENISARL